MNHHSIPITLAMHAADLADSMAIPAGPELNDFMRGVDVGYDLEWPKGYPDAKDVPVEFKPHLAGKSSSFHLGFIVGGWCWVKQYPPTLEEAEGLKSSWLQLKPIS